MYPSDDWQFWTIIFSINFNPEVVRRRMLAYVIKLTALLIHLRLAQSRTATSPLRSPPLILSVTDYGAAGDGVRYDTVPIQTAIDSCPPSPSRPCHVTFPPGSYLTTTMYLRSHVTLVVQRGATILGGTEMADYPTDPDRWYVIMAEGATDVGITGGGVVDGQGLMFVERFDERKNVMVSWNKTGNCVGDECRPRLVGFVGCKNVRVWGVELRLPAYWCLHIVRCQNTRIHDVSIYGDFNSPNNDGIDIVESNNTLITRCKIDTGDDAICAKTYTAPCHNLTVTDCWIRTKSSAIKIGSQSWFDFKGLRFDNINIMDSHRGLALQIRDGGNANDVTFSNINLTTRYYDPSWWGRAEPIYMTICPRLPTSKHGSVSNVRFINISATSENGVFLSGSKGSLLSNLRFSNVNVTYRRWTEYEEGLVDYRPGCQGLVNHSMAGFIMEHIEGLEIENVNMRWSESEGNSLRWNNPLDFRPSTVNDISLRNFHSGWFAR